jgi:hypothetical protein
LVGLTTSLRGLGAATAIAIAAMSCASAALPGPTQTVQPTATNTAAATFSVPATFASVCGTMSDGVQITRASATFLLNSPGRPPLRIASSGPAPIDMLVPSGSAQSGYVCLLLDAGKPLPIVAGLIGPQMPGFVADGTFPATAAQPAPTGFVLPQACAFVVPPVVGTDQTDWSIDCGAANNNNNARGTLGPALMQQGWALCASGLATAQWRKDNVMLGVVESTLAPGEYMRLIQFARVISPCS